MKAQALGKLAGTLLSVMVFAPLLLLCGANWLLEALGHAQFGYTLATWVGAFLFTAALRNNNR